jgi:predicted DCC family thiol-disulfide oxidoreductase YuxK
VQLYDSHASELVADRFPMLAGADFDQAMFAVTAQGTVFRGYFAFKAILRRLPLTWPLLLLFFLPGADVVGPRVYAWVARNRRRFGCTTETCDLPTPRSGRTPGAQ